MDNLLECPICYGIAVKAVETICCNRIFCEKCIIQYIETYKGEIECPLCMISPFETKKSVLGRRMINEMLIKCPNKCHAKIVNSSLQSHLEICPKRKIYDNHKKDDTQNDVEYDMNNNNTLNPDAAEFIPQQPFLYDQLCQYYFNPSTGEYVLNPYAQQPQLLQQQQYMQTIRDTQHPEPTQNTVQQQQQQSNVLNIVPPNNMLQQNQDQPPTQNVAKKQQKKFPKSKCKQYEDSSIEYFNVEIFNNSSIECKELNDGNWSYDRYLKYDKNKRIIKYNSSPSIAITGIVDIFNERNSDNNKHFGHWWRFKILQCNKISIGIVNKNHNRSYLLSSNGTLNGEYFNEGYTKNSTVDMFVYLSSDSLYILLYFSINGKRKRLKKIEYEKGNAYNMTVDIGGYVKLLKYSSSYNDIKNNENCNDTNNSSKGTKSIYVPSNYECFGCGAKGKHWITNCLNKKT